MYRDMIDDMIERYGVSCTVGESTVKALVQPMRYRYGSFACFAEEEGMYDERRYLYIGKAEDDLTIMHVGCELESGGVSYVIEFADMYNLCGTPLYCRAVLRRLGGAAV